MTVKQRLSLVRLGVDIEAELDMFCNNEDIYVECLKKFVTDCNYANMIDAIERGDSQKAFEAAHSLKGVSGNLGFTNLFNEVATITEVFRSKSMNYDEANFEALKTNYMKVIDTINTF